jgi:hypothetical protein
LDASSPGRNSLRMYSLTMFSDELTSGMPLFLCRADYTR